MESSIFRPEVLAVHIISEFGQQNCGQAPALLGGSLSRLTAPLAIEASTCCLGGQRFFFSGPEKTKAVLARSGCIRKTGHRKELAAAHGSPLAVPLSELGMGQS